MISIYLQYFNIVFFIKGYILYFWLRISIFQRFVRTF